MVSTRIRRGLVTGSEAVITHHGRNPQPIIGKDPIAAIALGQAMFLGLAPSRH